MRIPVIFLASVLALAALSGCKSKETSCHQDNKDYAGAKELPPLKAPPNLDPPNTRNALKVPPVVDLDALDTHERPLLTANPPEHRAA